MVRRGEYLERAVVIDGEAGPIEGLYHRGKKRPPALILPSAPLEGGSMEIAIVAELAWSVTQRGHATLRFNYRGVGASGGAFDGLEGAKSDAVHALAHLRATTEATEAAGQAAPLKVALLGVGMGAEIASRIAGEDGAVELVVLIAPEPSVLPAHPFCPVVAVLPEAAPPAHREAIAAWVERADDAPSVRLAVIPGADRVFLRGLVDLGKVVAEAISPDGFIDLRE